MFKLILILHVLGAAIWVGGHLVLLLGYVPKAWKNKDCSLIEEFEEKYEPIGIPALIVQIITGIYMAFFYFDYHFMSFSNGLERAANMKIILLLCIFALAIHARFFIIPKLNKDNLKPMIYHIIGINIISLLMLIIGVLFRFGGI
ncbi:copper resistance protein CopD [Ornithobacterium rhinotracheale]|uniref:CopD family protein n=1 Tax=Ornithobacterium rhinotracheale TaxID=28251 RepID=UPI00129D1684|nr:CopD family protein [Ornithobacterium rhinotracheale]MRI63558.1 copper resistance protein CopD [Ornithobacterium rhinotracheale]